MNLPQQTSLPHAFLFYHIQFALSTLLQNFYKMQACLAETRRTVSPQFPFQSQFPLHYTAILLYKSLSFPATHQQSPHRQIHQTPHGGSHRRREQHAQRLGIGMAEPRRTGTARRRCRRREQSPQHVQPYPRQRCSCHRISSSSTR